MAERSSPRPSPRGARSTSQAEPLWTVTELADYLRVPLATLYNWRCRGIGPSGIRVGKYVRYRPRDVEQWLRELEDQAS